MLVQAILDYYVRLGTTYLTFTEIMLKYTCILKRWEKNKKIWGFKKLYINVKK